MKEYGVFDEGLKLKEGVKTSSKIMVK